MPDRTLEEFLSSLDRDYRDIERIAKVAASRSLSTRGENAFIAGGLKGDQWDYFFGYKQGFSDAVKFVLHKLEKDKLNGTQD